MAASSPQLMLSLLFVAVLCVGSGTAGADTALDDICKSLGGHYITPDFCKVRALLRAYDPSLPCRDARGVAVLAARLVVVSLLSFKSCTQSTAPELRPQ